jgi:hypothetical protein
MTIGNLASCRDYGADNLSAIYGTDPDKTLSSRFSSAQALQDQGVGHDCSKILAYGDGIAWI